MSLLACMNRAILSSDINQKRKPVQNTDIVSRNLLRSGKHVPSFSPPFGITKCIRDPLVNDAFLVDRLGIGHEHRNPRIIRTDESSSDFQQLVQAASI